MSGSSSTTYTDYYFVRLLKLSPFERAPRGGWRFGPRRISDGVADRLVASGRAEIIGQQMRFKESCK